MTVKTLTDLRTAINAALPDNTTRLINPVDVRQTGLIDTIDSLEYARGLEEFDVRRFGPITFGITPGPEVQNDNTLAIAIAAAPPVLYIPAPITITKKWRFVDARTRIVGTEPSAINELGGGVMITGDDSATNDCMIEFVNGLMPQIENFRFYGHTDPATKVPALAIRLLFDEDIFIAVGTQNTRTTIRGTIIRHPSDTVDTFKKCFETNFEGAEGGTDEVLIENFRWQSYTEIGADIINIQSVGVNFSNGRFDGRVNGFENFPATGIKTRANTIINDVHFNRNQLCFNLNQASTLSVKDCHFEHNRKLIDITNGEAVFRMRGGKYNLDEDAYIDADEPEKLRFMDVRARHVSVEGLLLSDNNLNDAPRPHIFTGNIATSKGTVRFMDNPGIVLDDFDSENDRGSPSVKLRRIDDNVNGMWFEFRSAEDQLHIDKYIGAGHFNLD